MAEQNDEILMQQIVKGNRLAFELLYDRYFDKLVWFANRFVSDIPKAEDIVQEVFMKIIERPDQFNPSQRFSTWIYAITGNTCKNVLRNDQNRLKLLREGVSDQSANEIHHEGDYQQLQQRINTAISRLSEKERYIYSLRFEQELSIKEIAAIVNIPEGSVKSGVYYLLKKFAHQLKEFTHGN